ncbi:uncharacterized protein F5Z01DRAFT_215353 [Emericellopsis atlantica]|uniref:Enoyl reductase (ER) domain-containing protein n=1 Tax=Emericellopsis atlantica TaxID=2614577 RepID=A0A9P7ZV97_9HYPO|nr:uncharacterized protein F5Z01DRAFT_215353 [Emericellopsis atlantica]KAG9258716.1 hypothetical protein F5Z01DRAFT_215353 [Emericellopsis atlantica]
MASQWILANQDGFETALEFQQNIPIPTAADLGPKEVLVELRAASLNYRELVIAGPIGVNGPIKPPVVPGCDGAGIIKAVGSDVVNFQVGDRVVTHNDADVDRDGDDKVFTFAEAIVAMGQGADGTLRTHGVFHHNAVVHAPKTLDFLAASTLTTTWVTAWNAYFGLESRKLTPESWVLIQGTGGVSVAAAQIAVAFGANVVATTSTEERASRLKALGAVAVINYRTYAEIWGQKARELTPNGRGFDHILDVGGNETLTHSLKAVRAEGVISLIGAVGAASAETVPMVLALPHTCIVRGFIAGTRRQFQDLNRFIDEKKIQPAVDDVVFDLADAKDAYCRLKEKRHFAKVLIKIEQSAP